MPAGMPGAMQRAGDIAPGRLCDDYAKMCSECASMQLHGKKHSLYVLFHPG